MGYNCRQRKQLLALATNKERFSVDKAYHKVLVHRENLLEKALPKRMVVHPTLITTEGLKYNEYSGDFQKVVVLDELFEEAYETSQNNRHTQGPA